MSEAQIKSRKSEKEVKPSAPSGEDGFDFGSGFDKFASTNDANNTGADNANAFDFGGVIGGNKNNNESAGTGDDFQFNFGGDTSA